MLLGDLLKAIIYVFFFFNKRNPIPSVQKKQRKPSRPTWVGGLAVGEDYL
jgi:hypothetical protein